jgi:hypothetical protein
VRSPIREGYKLFPFPLGRGSLAAARILTNDRLPHERQSIGYCKINSRGKSEASGRERRSLINLHAGQVILPLVYRLSAFEGAL